MDRLRLNSIFPPLATTHTSAENVSSPNRCLTKRPLCDGNGHPTSVNEKDATGGASNTEVKFYRLIGADHFAVYHNANLSQYNPNFNSTTGVLSNDIVWNFFAAHPKP